MARLILHSDDFGLHRSINDAVIDGASQGVLTSCSLMANGLAVEDAVCRALRIPELGVGVHLNILRGRPLSDPDQVPSLVDEEGRFFNSAVKLAKKSIMGEISASEVCTEYRRQVEFVIKSGLSPTHLDSEKHTHLWLKESGQAMQQVMNEYPISKVRNIRETPLLKAFRSSGTRIPYGSLQFIKLLLLEFCSKKGVARWKGIQSTDYFFGVCVSGKYTADQTIGILQQMFQIESARTIEWMFHLGYDDPAFKEEINKDFGKYFLTSQRAVETRILLSEAFMKEIQNNKNHLLSYRGL